VAYVQFWRLLIFSGIVTITSRTDVATTGFCMNFFGYVGHATIFS